MANQNHIRVTSDGTAVGTKIFIDGVEMASATRLTLDVAAGSRMIATVEVYVDEVVVDGLVDVLRGPGSPLS